MNTESGPLRAGRERKTEETPRLSRPHAESQIFVGSLDKNLLQTVKVHAVPWGSSTYIDIRVFEHTADDAEHPTTAGIRLDSTLIPDLLGLLERAREYVRTKVVIVQVGGDGHA